MEMGKSTVIQWNGDGEEYCFSVEWRKGIVLLFSGMEMGSNTVIQWNGDRE
jgi:hypothetical protein